MIPPLSKRKTILFVMLLIVGIGVLAYPTISNFINGRHGSYAIAQLQEQLENADIAEQRRLAEAYNEKLRAAPKEITEEEYEAILNIANGMMGSLQIPKIEVNLPIYHGVSEETLTKGAGHMPESAFPIGGEGNHAVVTGHTGLPSAELFTDLTALTEGDRFYISILGETLTYEIDQIKVVLPNEGQDLAAVPGEDYCTLVTCTPYGINSHRLLVRGSRMETEEKMAEQIQTGENGEVRLTSLWLLLPVALITVRFVALFLVGRKK